MARLDTIRKLKQDRDVELDPDLLEHIRSVGFLAVDEYIAWCSQNGFSRRTNKHWKVRLKERIFAQRAVADSRLAQKKLEVRKPARIIESIVKGELTCADVTEPHLRAVCKAWESAQDSCRTRNAFGELLQQIRPCSELISNQPAIAHFGHQAGNTFVDGLLALARSSRNWIRPVADWKPQTHNTRRQFASLARHLFCEWPVPAFMDSVWFVGHSKEAARQQGWFLHIGQGQNIRTANIPLPYTKRMAHYFMQAPADYTVQAALRWGQIHGLGGNERLARALIGTRIGTTFEQDDFWITVFQFLIANPMLDPAHVGPIVDYIYEQRFVPEEAFLAPDILERRGPPQPNFTMKGRTPESLLRQVEAWHRGLAKIHQPKAEWPASGIDGFEFVEGTERGGNLKVWSITELLSTKALVAEGRKMRHCVVTYVHSCAVGECSIWSLEVETFEGASKILTLEVRNATRTICQARGKCNMLPGDKHRGIMRRWAEQAGLTLANYV